jgi:hypothetical protein
MATLAAATFYERDLLKMHTMTITVKGGRIHPFLRRFGLWLAFVGFRVSGVGQVQIIEGEDQP